MRTCTLGWTCARAYASSRAARAGARFKLPRFLALALAHVVAGVGGTHWGKQISGILFRTYSCTLCTFTGRRPPRHARSLLRPSLYCQYILHPITVTPFAPGKDSGPYVGGSRKLTGS
ncbi:hypothetical protein EmuJ_000551200 [Echinococcus multilocularis]|uniref:Uncharacterized protein n=1 Tax=Echinococcus multilocularis TaxID=6211 RepID=A0A068Y4S1_ECHMU|nr:hypothetical protein EmuJ_000551200 [Echinococcus multilocularis]